MELANALYNFILVMHIALMVIVVYLVCSWVHDIYHEKHMHRYSTMVKDTLPEVGKEFTEMSLDVIKRINDNIFEQYCQEKES